MGCTSTTSLAVVRTLCISGARREFVLWNRVRPNDDAIRRTAEDLTLAENRQDGMQREDMLQFLRDTRGFVNPLEYSDQLDDDEACYWLRSERLRDFPQIAFENRGKASAGDIIQSALEWTKENNGYFPVSCRKRVQELLGIQWEKKGQVLTREFMIAQVLPFVVDRWEEDSRDCCRHSAMSSCAIINRTFLHSRRCGILCRTLKEPMFVFPFRYTRVVSCETIHRSRAASMLVSYNFLVPA